MSSKRERTPVLTKIYWIGAFDRGLRDSRAGCDPLIRDAGADTAKDLGLALLKRNRPGRQRAGRTLQGAVQRVAVLPGGAVQDFAHSVHQILERAVLRTRRSSKTTPAAHVARSRRAARWLMPAETVRTGTLI